MGASVRRPRIGRVLRKGSVNLRVGGSVLAVLRERHCRSRRSTTSRRRSTGKPLQPGQQRALLPCAAGMPIRPLVNAVVPSTKASRGQASRCAGNAVSAASASPATSRPKNAIWLASRAGKPAARALAAAMASRAAASMAAFQQRVRAGDMREGKTGIRGYGTIERLDRTPGTSSASPHNPAHRRPVRRMRRWTGGGRSGPSA